MNFYPKLTSSTSASSDVMLLKEFLFLVKLAWKVNNLVLSVSWREADKKRPSKVFGLRPWKRIPESEQCERKPRQTKIFKKGRNREREKCREGRLVQKCGTTIRYAFCV